jgi:hypothetical protein
MVAVAGQAHDGRGRLEPERVQHAPDVFLVPHLSEQAPGGAVSQALDTTRGQERIRP